MREIQNIEQLEVTFPMGRKATTNKAIILDLVIKNMIFTQQCFVLPISNPVILESDFLDIHFAVLDIGDHTILMLYANYMLTTSLTQNLVYD